MLSLSERERWDAVGSTVRPRMTTIRIAEILYRPALARSFGNRNETRIIVTWERRRTSDWVLPLAAAALRMPQWRGWTCGRDEKPAQSSPYPSLSPVGFLAERLKLNVNDLKDQFKLVGVKFFPTHGKFVKVGKFVWTLDCSKREIGGKVDIMLIYNLSTQIHCGCGRWCFAGFNGEAERKNILPRQQSD